MHHRQQDAARGRSDGFGAGGQWTAPDVALAPGEVHVFMVSVVDPPASPGALLDVLSAAEVERAGRFARADDRRRFVVGRATLRALLGACLSVPPERIDFVEGPHGKPELAPDMAQGGLRFNVAHSGGWVLLAAAHGVAVGVDVERVRPLPDAEALAERFFAAAEAAALRALPDGLRAGAFFACWTRKEAFVKAHGAGLTLPLGSFEVTLCPGDAPAVVRVDGPGDTADAWSVWSLAPDDGYIGAVVARTRGATLFVWRWSASDGLCPRPTRPSP